MKSLMLLASILVVACGGDDSGESSGSSEICERACNRHIGCANDPAANCLADCEGLRGTCTAEFDAFSNCGVNRPDSDFYCDAQDESQLADGVCETEAEAYVACTLQ